jgi:putative redox protein
MSDPILDIPGALVAEDAGSWVTARLGSTGFRTDITARAHNVVADEPVTVGGTDRGPTPYEFLLTALASCTVMTLRMYASRKGWPLDGATVQLRSGRSHELDCEKCETDTVGIGIIERRVELLGNLTPEQKQRLLSIADRCPVKQTLEKGIRVQSVSAV